MKLSDRKRGGTYGAAPFSIARELSLTSLSSRILLVDSVELASSSYKLVAGLLLLD